jgi:hypothetical protein
VVAAWIREEDARVEVVREAKTEKSIVRAVGSWMRKRDRTGRGFARGYHCGHRSMRLSQGRVPRRAMCSLPDRAMHALCALSLSIEGDPLRASSGLARRRNRSSGYDAARDTAQPTSGTRPHTWVERPFNCFCVLHDRRGLAQRGADVSHHRHDVVRVIRALAPDGRALHAEAAAAPTPGRALHGATRARAAPPPAAPPTRHPPAVGPVSPGTRR